MLGDVIIVEGGQAALAVAYYLRKYGIDPLILDSQPAPDGSWCSVWPSMTLFSTPGFSNLPGVQMPDYDDSPPVSHVIDYLSPYEKRHELRVQRPANVTHVIHDGISHLTSDAGDFEFHQLVAATGNRPLVLYYLGMTSVKQWHSADYPGPEPLDGSRAAVIGAVNLGAQVVAEPVSSGIDTIWPACHEPRRMPDDVDGYTLFKRNRQRALAIIRGKPDPGPSGSIGNVVIPSFVRKTRDSGVLAWIPMSSSPDDVHTDHLTWRIGFCPALSLFRSTGSDLIEFVGHGNRAGLGAATTMSAGLFVKRVAERVVTRLSV